MGAFGPCAVGFRGSAGLGLSFDDLRPVDLQVYRLSHEATADQRSELS